MSVSAYERPRDSKLLLHGIIGGVVAGIIFAMAEMIISLIMGMSFFGPLRLISTIVLGTQAAQPDYPLVTAAVVGVIVHMMFSAVYGVIFVYLLALLRQLRASTWRLLVAGTVYGFLLWVLNFLVIAPIAFPQFTQVNQFWNGFVAHTFFFGTVIGAYVVAMNEKLLGEG